MKIRLLAKNDVKFFSRHYKRTYFILSSLEIPNVKKLTEQLSYKNI